MRIVKRIVGVLEYFAVPFTFLGAIWLKFIRKHEGGLKRNWNLLKKLKIVPVIDHYYEPMISKEQFKGEVNERNLLGIDLNVNEQITFIENLCYKEEILKIPIQGNNHGEKQFYFKNGSFGPGDAEFLYGMIRFQKPKKIIEVGSGNSTLIAVKAIEENKREDDNYKCDMICIEPFEQPWLERLHEIKVVRKKVETVPIEFFQSLEEKDILFIDSSHVIRPQGDILWEYQNILPALQKGVYIHIHDIFTPKDYPEKWMFDEVRLWNEQYFVEAFLAYNDEFRIVGALNYLKHHHWEIVQKQFPVLSDNKDYEPGSLWIQKH